MPVPVKDSATAAAATAGAAELLEALERRPGGPQLLAMGREGAEISLVGGAVRDLLLGREPRELDVVVAGDELAVADELARRLRAAGAAPLSRTSHERFGTAVLEWRGGRIDLARRRAESYPAPGALPEVRPAGEPEDLMRRDFSVNAIALPLGPDGRGELHGAPGALADLAQGRLRVLHDLSFNDDPTRLLRIARYSARLGFCIEAHTGALAAAAIAAGVLSTVTPARLGAELRLALDETGATAALAAMSALGVLGPLGLGAGFDEPLAAAALALLPAEGRAQVLLLALLLLAPPGGGEAAELARRLDALEVPASVRDGALAAAHGALALPARMQATARPSELHELLAREPLEAVALAGALAERSDLERGALAAGEWLGELRGVALAITGEDLLAAGVPQGPEVGARLSAALARRLDGQLGAGADAELAAALEAL